MAHFVETKRMLTNKLPTGSPILLKIVSEDQLSGNAYFYTIAFRRRAEDADIRDLPALLDEGFALIELTDQGSVQQFRLSSQFWFQCCNLPQLLYTQKNVPFHLNLNFNLQFQGVQNG